MVRVKVKVNLCVMNWLKKRWSWIALLIVLVVGGWFAAYRLDEPAWEMNHHGYIMAEWPHNAANYLRFGLSTQSGLVMDYGWVPPAEGFTFRIDHPPVTSWTIALSYVLSGIHEWSARLVPLLFSLGLVILLFVLARRISGDGWALLVAVFAIANPAFLYFARLPVPHVPAVFFAVATFVWYREWVARRDWKCLIGMWACFAIGAWTDWVVYFVMPWILVHYILFQHRRHPDRRFLVVSLLLPFALFALYIVWTFAVGGVEPLLKLFEIFRWRTGSNTELGGQRYIFTWGDLYQLSYGWVKLFLTPTLWLLALVWVGSFAGRILRRRELGDGFLVLCLFLYGLIHNLLFTNRVYFHSFITAFEWIPFFALAGALGVRALSRIVVPPWRPLANVALVVVSLFLFISQSSAAVAGLHREQLRADYYLAGTQIGEAVPREGKVMLSFRPDIRLLYYVDRPWDIVTKLEEFEALIEADPSYSHYVYAPGSDVPDELRRYLVAHFPVVNSGQYAVFGLREAGEKSLVEDKDSLEISHRANVRFGDSLLLLGYDLEPEILQAKEEAGGWERHLNAHADLMPEHNAHSRVTYYWQALKSPERDYEIRSQFVAEYGDEYVIDHSHQPVNGAYPTSMWQEGEVVREAYVVAVPGGEPPLRYALRVSVADSETGDVLPVADAGESKSAGEGQVALGYLEVEPVRPPRGEVTAPEMQEVLRQELGNGLAFEGYSLAAGGNDVRTVRAGRTLEVTTSWSSDGSVDEDYPAWVELGRGGSRVRALLGVEPTRLWESGRYYLRRGELALSPYLLPGQYDLSVVVGGNPEQRVALGAVEVGWAKNRNRIIDQMGVADGEKGDVRPLDTDRALRLNFSLDHPMGLEVTAGWVGEALVDETRVEVYVRNRRGERYLTTWVVPRGEHTVSSLHIPEELTVGGSNSVILRVPEERGKPHYVGWRAWVDAVLPDLLYDLSGPHDGWIWADFITVTSDWSEEWGAYRDLAQRYSDLEMYDEVTELFDEAVDNGLRPEQVEELNVFLEAFDKSGAAEKAAQVEEAVRSLVPHRMDVNLEDKVELVGYSLERTAATEGRLRLFFRSLQSLEADYTLWLHQYQEGAEEFVSLDRRLGTSRWQPGRVYEKNWTVDLAAGEVRFVLGFWRWEDGSRLWVKDAPEQHEIDLGWVEASQSVEDRGQ